MKELFADTFYFIALLSPTDRAHERARTITSSQQSKLVTTLWVLTELANSLAKRDTRTGFLNTLAALESDPMVTINGHEQQLYEGGIELYRNRPDKDWSLIDCISFVVMEKRKMTDALTGDHHFEQAGFKALLRV